MKGIENFLPEDINEDQVYKLIEESSPIIEGDVTYPKTMYSTANDVNVRKEASTASEIVTKINKNNKVEVSGRIGDWYKVTANGKAGYVSAKLLSDTSN